MAAMRTSVGRLYTLFDACLPNNESVKRRLAITNIIESKSYNELKRYSPFSKLFDNYFSNDKLSTYSLKELADIEKAIPKIIPLIEKLNRSIIYGNAYKLTEKDIPNFCSPSSIDKLSAKLKTTQTEPNITNISSNNFIEIFSSKTEKDLSKITRGLTEDDSQNIAEAITKKFSSTIYCFSNKEVNNLQKTINEKLTSTKEKLESLNEQKWKIRIIKMVIICMVILLLVAVNSFELLSAGGLSALTIVICLIAIVFAVLG